MKHLGRKLCYLVWWNSCLDITDTIRKAADPVSSPCVESPDTLALLDTIGKGMKWITFTSQYEGEQKHLPCFMVIVVASLQWPWFQLF